MEDSFLQVIILDHQVRSGVVLGEAIVDRVAHCVSFRGADPIVSLNGGTYENVL